MRLVLDVENTVTERAGAKYLDPFEPENTLVMVGILSEQNEEEVFVFDHSEVDSSPNGHTKLQSKLDQATLLIGHNISHDLVWLWETGFKYSGPVFDTMLAEYVMLRGRKAPLSLGVCAERYKLNTMKGDTMKNYLKQDTSVRDIPYDELYTYLLADLHATQELFTEQSKWLDTLDMCALKNTVTLSNEMAIPLSKIYTRGFNVNLDTLYSVRDQFTTERGEILSYLEAKTRELMGDVPINLASPEQLSTVIYGRKPKDKRTWAELFLSRVSDSEFSKIVDEHTQFVYKSHVRRCSDCIGSGKVRKKKKNGELFKKENRCPSCDGRGYHIISSSTHAGLGIRPPSSKWVASHGFVTNKGALQTLESLAKQHNKPEAATFLQKVQRLSALDTYLSTFVDGIEKHVKADGRLHVRLNQHTTSTGRLSGKEPNMQNMPRGGTFPVKKVFISRWEGGKILEADFAQLEFRAAAFLSQDPVAMSEVNDGFDVHTYTANVISHAGQQTTRQEAKAHTFAPLYGATGYGRTKAEAAYYTHFNEKYQGISKWHQKLAKQAITSGVIETPSGRQFHFPDVERRMNGSVTYFTQIKNYPVQSFATADIVPLAILEIEKLLEPFESCIVNTVHDSIVVDVHPDEVSRAIWVVKVTNERLPDLIKTRWGVDFNVPLVLEPKIGENWLELNEAA